jgi:hypothetical protein
LAPVEVIFDRLEGRARQQIEVAEITAELRQKSEDELQTRYGRFYDGDMFQVTP